LPKIQDLSNKKERLIYSSCFAAAHLPQRAAGFMPAILTTGKNPAARR
jgi:hypothetical protein